MIFTPDGSRILGAQIVGAEGVDKRIDVISTAARLGAKATDLAKLELTYAPPYSSAKDPVNMAGFVIRNVLDGLVKFAEWDVLESGETVQVLDIREDAERMAFELPGSINIPLGTLRDRMKELDPGKPVVVLSSIGVRSYSAARVLMQNGFEDVRVYPAGTRFYRSSHYEDFAQIPETTENGGPDMATDNNTMKNTASADISMRLDCSGMQCPGPILKVYEGIQKLEDGQTLEVRASDPGFAKDVAAWCRRTGNSLIYNSKEGFDYVARIRKGAAGCDISAPNVRNVPADQSPLVVNSGNDGKTIIVFSGDMDKVMASFIIANGAAALG